ncbi:MAG: hypothetical protein NTW46_03600, partial [Candidatus Nealsonbacteria bacterium]|nr:hypothetical protein [Candidatus Nealsonbacteria bacterium]
MLDALRVIDLMPPVYFKLMVVLVELEVDWDFTLWPSTKAVKLPLTSAVGMVIATLPVVPLEPATVKVIARVFELNVRAETEEVELTEM